MDSMAFSEAVINGWIALFPAVIGHVLTVLVADIAGACDSSMLPFALHGTPPAALRRYSLRPLGLERPISQISHPIFFPSSPKHPWTPRR